jgi:hypothetical protein
MIQVSKRFKEKVYASTRKTTAKVTFEILDNEAYKDNTITVPTESVISRKSQIANKKRNMSYKYATFEKDYFKLDGSFCIPPKSNEGNSELGYWSNELSNENGIFSPYQVIEVNFTKVHSSMGLAIAFDVLTSEYAADFDIEVYGSGDTLIHRESVIDNISLLYVLETNLENYKKIIITIKKWCKGFRRARVVEIDFGLVKEYKDSKLIKLNVLEEMNVIGDTIPSNEITFMVDNSDRAFNILNPSGFTHYLKERQEVTAALGLQVNDEDEETEEYEFIPMGKFYLVDWQSDEGTMTTTFTARDIFEILENTEYISITNTNLYDLAEDVLIKAAIEEYSIDNSLKNISTNGFKDVVTSRNALQCIGIAARSMVYQDRLGVLRIRHFETLTESTGYLYFTGTESYSGAVTPEVDENFDMKYIDFDNLYKEPQVKLDKLIKSITIMVHDGTESGQKVKVNSTGVSKGAILELDNPLINSVSQAQVVGAWILRESNLRVVYEADWRQNPALEPGDVVLIEDGFEARKRSKITRQEFNYEGFLGGKTGSKGGI